MTQFTDINISSPDDGLGDPIRTGGDKINSNFDLVDANYGFQIVNVSTGEGTSPNNITTRTVEKLNSAQFTITRQAKIRTAYAIGTTASYVEFDWVAGTGDYGATGTTVTNAMLATPVTRKFTGELDPNDGATATSIADSINNGGVEYDTSVIRIFNRVISGETTIFYYKGNEAVIGDGVNAATVVNADFDDITSNGDGNTNIGETEPFIIEDNIIEGIFKLNNHEGLFYSNMDTVTAYSVDEPTIGGHTYFEVNTAGLTQYPTLSAPAGFTVSLINSFTFQAAKRYFMHVKYTGNEILYWFTPRFEITLGGGGSSNASDITVDSTNLRVIDNPTDLQDYLDQNDSFLFNARSTGVSRGGQTAVNGGLGTGNGLDITAGSAQILDNTNSDDTLWTFSTISWNALTNVPLATNNPNITYWYFDDNSGNVKQQTTKPTELQLLTRAYIAITSAFGTGTTITGLKPYVTTLLQTSSKIRTLSRALGILKLDTGLDISANGANLQFNINAGEFYDYGGNWNNSTATTDTPEYPQTNAVNFRYVIPSGVINNDRTTLDVGNYAPNGIISPLPNNRFAIHFVFVFSGNNEERVAYGNQNFTSIANATTALANIDPFNRAPAAFRGNALCVGAIIVRNNTIALNIPTTALIVNTNKFGLFGGAVISAGSGFLAAANNLSDLTDISAARTNISVYSKAESDGLYEAAFTKNTAFNKNFGTVGGTVAEGNDARIQNGQVAFGWGDHAQEGYLTTETDPTVPAHVKAITTTDISDWDSAYDYSQVGHLPLTGGTLTGRVFGKEFEPEPTAPLADANDFTTLYQNLGGLSLDSAGGTNYPSASGMVLRMATSITNTASDRITELFSDRVNAEWYIRRVNNGTSSGWLKLWHEGNLNYVPSTGGTFTGDVVISKSDATDAVLRIESDTDNDTETANPRIELRQDGGLIGLNVGCGEVSEMPAGFLPNAAFLQTVRTNEAIQFFHANNLAFTLENGGIATFEGNVTADDFIQSSDERIKDNVKPIEKTIDIEFKQYNKNGSDRVEYGVIAQDLEKVAPDLVHTDKKGMKSVSYTSLLIAKIDELEKRLEQLEAK